MFIEKSSTEIITLENEVMIIGLSLQKSGLPISFDSLGTLWGIYGEKHRGNEKNAVLPIVEYAVCLNEVPDYITGYSVTEIGELDEGWSSYVIKPGKYIKDTFNAETFHKLTTEAMQKRDVKKWAKNNKVKIDGEFLLEVYPIDAVKDINVEMYTLTPIKE